MPSSAMVHERAIPVQNRNCIKPFHYVYPCDSQATTAPKVRGSNPLRCTCVFLRRLPWLLWSCFTRSAPILLWPVFRLVRREKKRGRRSVLIECNGAFKVIAHSVMSLGPQRLPPNLHSDLHSGRRSDHQAGRTGELNRIASRPLFFSFP